MTAPRAKTDLLAAIVVGKLVTAELVSVVV
jgi:hypothetical protein